MTVRARHALPQRLPQAFFIVDARDGKEATLDEAIEAAAGFLHEAHLPLVYGLSNVTCEAQRESVALAEMIGGVVDSHTSL